MGTMVARGELSQHAPKLKPRYRGLLPRDIDVSDKTTRVIFIYIFLLTRLHSFSPLPFPAMQI